MAELVYRYLVDKCPDEETLEELRRTHGAESVECREEAVG